MSTAQNDNEIRGRRVHQRFAIEVDAEVTSDGNTFGVVTRDVSRGGMCFVVFAPMAVGSSFTFSLSLVLGENAFSEPLVLSGVVIWCTKTPEGYQIGAALQNMTKEIHENLQLFLKFLTRGLDINEAEEVADEDDEDDEHEDGEEKGLFG